MKRLITTMTLLAATLCAAAQEATLPTPDAKTLGMGGVATAEDALEFILAGATGVAVGTANFVNPTATLDVIDGIQAYMEKYGVKDIHELIGAVK